MSGLIVFDLDGVITTEAGYWAIVRKGLRPIVPPEVADDPFPPDFIYWAKNHAINHNWDAAFVALTAAGRYDEFRAAHEHLSGRALLEACPGYRDEPWRQLHRSLQAIQDASPLPDEGLHTPEETKALFETLATRGFTFAVATGRPRPEALAPLDRLGIRRFFEDRRIITHQDVEAAEREAAIPLGKPHPFVVYRAMYPDLPLDTILHLPPEPHPNTWFIGDTASDMGAAAAARVTPIGILSALPPGPYREERRHRLADLGCERLLDSVLDLPAALD